MERTMKSKEEAVEAISRFEQELDQFRRQMQAFSENTAQEEKETRSTLYKVDAKCKELEAQVNELRSRFLDPEDEDPEEVQCVGVHTRKLDFRSVLEDFVKLLNQSLEGDTGTDDASDGDEDSDNADDDCRLVEVVPAPKRSSKDSKELPPRKRPRVPEFANETDIDANGRSLLHWLAKAGDTEGVKRLLDKDFDTRLQDKNGDTPLHIAIKWEREATAMCLVEADSKIDIENQDGQTPLHLAMLNGFAMVVRKLVDADSDDLFGKQDGETSLIEDISSIKKVAAELVVDCATNIQGGNQDKLHTAHLLLSVAKYLVISCARTPDNKSE